MNPTRIAFYVALLWVALPLAGMLSVRSATPLQSADQTDSTSAKKAPESKPTPAAPSATGATRGAAASPAPAAKPARENTPAAKPASPATTPATSTPAASKPAATQQTRPANGTGMVWVNTDSGIYHKPGSRYYGKTKQGKYMSEADAIKAGYRAAGKN